MFIAYLSSYLYTWSMKSRIDSDVIKTYMAKNAWNEVLSNMGNMVTNWYNGETFNVFKYKVQIYKDNQLRLSERLQSRKIYPKQLKQRFAALDKASSMVDSRLQIIINRIEDPSFYVFQKKVETDPGLQKLNRLWIELFYLGDRQQQEKAYILNQVVNEIEFFPIYSESINILYNQIINKINNINSRVTYFHRIFSIIFLIFFIVTAILFSLKSTKTIVMPIKRSVQKLTYFLGTTIEKIESKNKDELELLTNSTDTLIAHYSKISNFAQEIAKGNLKNIINPISNKDIIGNSLNDIHRYLKELANASCWIKDGHYGAQVPRKSEDDILSENFNYMSIVINDKIRTLKNIFDAVDEAIVVIDSDFKVIEMNNNFLELIGMARFSKLDNRINLQEIFRENIVLLRKHFEYQEQGEAYTELYDLNGILFPVKIRIRIIREIEETKSKLMLVINNESWKVRSKRERENLKSQATLAELKSLRTQINPHFFFNTLNTIANLVENDSGNAVDIIVKLADLFRYTLDASKNDFVNVIDEINHVKKYIEIEKIRFGSRLNIQYDIDPQLTQEQIPSMLLQPIIENALKYGNDKNGIIYLYICIKRIEDSMYFRIADQGNRNISTKTLLSGDGTGLKNVNKRLETLFRQKLSFENNKPSGLCVTFSIPAIYK